jgi:hypothetical protein
MDVDQSSMDSSFGTCEHTRALEGSSKMLAYYEKALAWSGVKYGTDHHSKRRKVSSYSIIPNAILIAR